MKSFYDKLERTKYNSKNSKIERKKNRRKFKVILKSKDPENFVYFEKYYFRKPMGQYHIGPWNKAVNKFLEKNVNRPWDEVYHEFKETLKYSEGKFNISLNSLLNNLFTYTDFTKKYRNKFCKYYVVDGILKTYDEIFS